MMKITIHFLLICISLAVFGQNSSNCDKILNQEPYFIKMLSDTNQIFNNEMMSKDFEILNHCGSFDSLDCSIFFTKEVFASYLIEYFINKNTSYYTILEFTDNYRKTKEYNVYRASPQASKNDAIKEEDFKNGNINKLFGEKFQTYEDCIGFYENFSLNPESTGDSLKYTKIISNYKMDSSEFCIMYAIIESDIGFTINVFKGDSMKMMVFKQGYTNTSSKIKCKNISTKNNKEIIENINNILTRRNLFPFYYNQMCPNKIGGKTVYLFFKWRGKEILKVAIEDKDKKELNQDKKFILTQVIQLMENLNKNSSARNDF